MAARTIRTQGQAGGAIAWPATLAGKRSGPLRAQHLRFTPREAHTGALHCFLLDCSSSMMGDSELAIAKGLLLASFDRAARERAQVALISFGGLRADLRFGPVVPRWWNERWLEPLGADGGTPFSLGVARAERLLARARRLKPAQQRVLWLLTDGRCTQRPARPAAAQRIVVVDCERAWPRLGRCVELARDWGGEYVRLEDLTPPVAFHTRDLLPMRAG